MSIEAISGPVLVIVAHPDDIEAHCAGTIARLVSRGTSVSYLLATSGNRGSTNPDVSAEEIAGRREAEQMRAAEIIGVERMCFLRYDDSDLLFHQPRLRDDLTRVIREARPQTIITHDPYQTAPYDAGSPELLVKLSMRAWHDQLSLCVKATGHGSLDDQSRPILRPA